MIDHYYSVVHYTWEVGELGIFTSYNLIINESSENILDADFYKK